MATKQTKNGAVKGAANAVAKLKFDNYTAGKKLKPGQHIAVFGTKGIKLLNTVQLLPSGTAQAVLFTGFGRTLMETYDTQYGYGSSPIAGRFAFKSSNATRSDWFGWLLMRLPARDISLDFNVYMGAWVSGEPGPINFMLLELHLLIASGQPVLTVSVNGSEVDYAFDSLGDKRILVWVRDPGASYSQAEISLKLKHANNTSNDGIWVNRVERYYSIYLPPTELGELELGL